MRTSLIIITVLTLFLVSFVILAQPIGRCDPSFPPLTGVDIEGAHIVSEGAYFRFWIFNNNSFSIRVAVNGADISSVPPKSGIDYDVIAPQISAPYEQLTYKFSLTSSSYPAKTVDFTVLVLNSSFVQVFELAIPILIAVTTTILSIIAVFIVNRKRGHISFPVFLGALLIIAGIEVIFIFASGVLDQPLQLNNIRFSERGMAIEEVLSAGLILIGIIILMNWWMSSSHKHAESQK